MNGFDYLKFKTEPAIKNIPVIVLSNLGDKESVEKAKGLGVGLLHQIRY